jgi:hypothetical protein
MRIGNLLIYSAVEKFLRLVAGAAALPVLSRIA